MTAEPGNNTCASADESITRPQLSNVSPSSSIESHRSIGAVFLFDSHRHSHIRRHGKESGDGQKLLCKPTAGILTSEDMAGSPETAKSCCVSQQRAFSHPKTWQGVRRRQKLLCKPTAGILTSEDMARSPETAKSCCPTAGILTSEDMAGSPETVKIDCVSQQQAFSHPKIWQGVRRRPKVAVHGKESGDGQKLLCKPTAGILTSEDMAGSPETAKIDCVSQQQAFSHPKTWQGVRRRSKLTVESGDGQKLLCKPTAGILTSEDMAGSPETAKIDCVSQQQAFSHPKTWQGVRRRPKLTV
ncbi:hypothetical protein V8E54_013211 [Elaphomyces granulatus]